MKRTIILLVAVIMSFALLAGCNNSDANEPDDTKSQETKTQETEKSTQEVTEETEPAEIIKVRFLVPGDSRKDSELVDAAVTEEMQADGVALEFNRTYIPWDAWQQKTNVMLTSGEEFELIQVMEDWIPPSTYISMGAFVALDEYLDEYGPELKEAIPDYMWDIATQQDGSIYTIPVAYRDMGFNQQLSVQKQLWDKYDTSFPPASLDDVVDGLIAIKEGEDNPDLLWYFGPTPKTLDQLNRVHDSFPFAVRDSLIYIDQQGNVKPWLETEEFKKNCEFYRGLYVNGIISKDILTMPADERNRHSELGDSIFASYVQEGKIYPDRPDIEWADFQLVAEKPMYRGEFVYMNSNAVSTTSENPEAGVQFFNWLYSAQENFDLLCYGVQDTHWSDISAEKGGNKYYRVLGDTTNPEYDFYDWCIGNYNFVRIPEGTSEALLPGVIGFDSEAVNAVSAGFQFDTTQVNAEYTRLLADLQTYIYPIKYGVVDFDEYYPEAIAAMKASGYDKVIADFDRQFQAWLSAKE